MNQDNINTNDESEVLTLSIKDLLESKGFTEEQFFAEIDKVLNLFRQIINEKYDNDDLYCLTVDHILRRMGQIAHDKIIERITLLMLEMEDKKNAH